MKSRLIRTILASGTIMATVGLALTSATPASASGKGTVAFLLSGPDLYYQYGLKGAQAAATKLGYTVKAYPNPNGSASVELANVKDAIAQGVVAIDGYSVGLSTEDATIAAASRANVPIFLMYGYSHKYLNQKDVVGFEQVNLSPFSYPVGKWLGSHVKGQIAIITGQLGRGDAEGYRTGFLQGLGCKGNLVAGLPTMTCANGSVTYVDTETGHWLRPAAYTAMQDIIGKYPNLAGVFVMNEDMAVGAHTALVAAHKSNVVEVSQNGAPYGLAGIAAGWLKASDTCSPALEGINSIRLIDGYINHKISGGHLYYSYSTFVTKANLSQAVGWTVFQSPTAVAKYMSQPLLTPVANPPM